MSRAPHHCVMCAIRLSIICLIQLMCPRGAHSVSFLRPLLGKDLNADSASMARVTLIERPLLQVRTLSCVGVRGPACNSCAVAMVV
eukprot:417298-Pyramimonas_sp.AAC.1